ncbi:MAG TPA: hypothetical protein H9908_04050 [Candidatus Rothia avistercoris]|uniref:Uncharacterized protein n=1 Tax=Candidatus Rothia avistercoris TaxID=2840479 RepID=A0A9D2ZSI2_9MICC|nr:hypothetical protein [Candidatus Rothia avistercoris]
MLSVSRRNFLSLTASGWGKLIFEDDFNNGTIDGASSSVPPLRFVWDRCPPRVLRGGHFFVVNICHGVRTPVG